MHLHTRYQAFCEICNQVFEGDTAGQAVEAADGHLLEVHINPKRRFNPISTNAELCLKCHELGMSPYSSSTATARQCANPNCRFIEERGFK